MDLKYAVGAALVAGAFAAVPATAADTSAQRARADAVFTQLDKNNDGNIDATEGAARPWLQQSFSTYDHDHDGKLGKDEFAEAFSAQRVARRDARGATGATANSGNYFDSLDKNNDGNLDATEAAAVPWLQQNFATYDTDHNGKLGKDEFAAAMSAQPAAATATSAAAGATSSALSFDSLDKNNDGNIDATEAAAVPWLQQNFATYDTDHNGKLGKDEFAAAAASPQATAALGASAAAGGTAAAAQTFESLDKNNDGNIDATEAAAAPWLQQSFSTYDTDHNGKLGKDEYAAAQKAQPK